MQIPAGRVERWLRSRGLSGRFPLAYRLRFRFLWLASGRCRLVSGTPKSHERRSVPIPRFLADELTIHLAGREPRDLVFTTPTGQPLRNRNARRAWFDRAVAAIGEPDLTPHGLRHTAASLAVSAGANVKAVQRMLGHASAAMTLDRYADLFDDDLDAVAERLRRGGADRWRVPDVYRRGCGATTEIVGEGRGPMNPGAVGGGRYWDRTSDPCRVKAVLSR